MKQAPRQPRPSRVGALLGTGRRAADDPNHRDSSRQRLSRASREAAAKGFCAGADATRRDLKRTTFAMTKPSLQVGGTGSDIARQALSTRRLRAQGIASLHQLQTAGVDPSKLVERWFPPTMVERWQGQVADALVERDPAVLLAGKVGCSPNSQFSRGLQTALFKDLSLIDGYGPVGWTSRPMTGEEFAVIRLFAHGLSLTEIAEQLPISARRADSCVDAIAIIYRLLRPHTPEGPRRRELVVRYLAGHGLFTVSQEQRRLIEDIAEHATPLEKIMEETGLSLRAIQERLSMARCILDLHNYASPEELLAELRRRDQPGDLYETSVP